MAGKFEQGEKPEMKIGNVKQKLMLLKKRIFCYPGHYYSPIPSVKEVSKHEELFDCNVDVVPGVELQYEYQMQRLEEWKQYYNELSFNETQKEDQRYYFENGMYSYADGIFYYFMLRSLQPHRVIEIGSGFSSALLMDVNEKYFSSNIQVCFIEPYAQRLKKLLRRSDKVRILEKKLQDVELKVFESLRAGDILFIDSTHVVKTGSDVNYIFSKILPVLKEGVYIHFHDIFYPFEYPKEWVMTGRAWNEDYMLRSFLQYNHSFEIVLWNHYLITKNPEWFAQNMPLCLKNSGGGIWIKKTGA